MRRDSVVQAVAVAGMLAFLSGSVLLTTRVSASAGRAKLSYTDTLEEGTPPMVAVGVAMGAFRGLFVNYLWIRANNLKEEGKYHEAVDLATTITKLQPRFPRVWAFHAWNLSYNISVATQTPQERWQWVQSGIALLRDQGIPANPGDVLLHKELAWIFLHKVQGVMDDANAFYKQELARQWTIVLGPPPRRDDTIRTREQLIEAYAARLDRLVATPDTLEELFRRVPGTAELVERLRTRAGWDLTGRLWTELGTGPGELLLTLNEEMRSASRMQQTLKGVQARRTGLNAAAYEALNDPGVPLEAKAGVVNFVRKRLLVDRHKMEPERMARYTRKYGPLDWRHAGAHGLYWAARGVEEGMLRIGEQNRDDFDFVNTDRLVMHAIQELYRTGEITFDFFNPRFFMQLPNPDFVQSYVEAIEEIANREAEIATGRKGSKWYDPKTRLYTLYGAGFENFLRDAIRFLYRRGDREAAEHYRDVIVHYKGLNLNNQKLHESLTLPLDEFVVAEVRDDDRFTSPEVARSEVVGALQAAYLSGLLAGNSTAFRSNMDYARSFHKIYVEKQVFETAVNRGREARLEVMDRDFDVYAARVLAGLVQAAQIPDGPVMYQAAPADLQARTYAMLDLSGFKAEVDALAQGQEGAPTFDHWFPPPQGMEPVMEATREYLRTARAEHGVEVK